MATITADQATAAAIRAGFWTRARKAGTVYLVLGLIATIGFGAAAGTRAAKFTFTQNADGAHVTIPAAPGAIGFGLLCVIAGLVLLSGRAGRLFGWMTGLAMVGFVGSFLCWQVEGTFMPLGDIAQGSLYLALPLILGALGGVLCERSAVINVAIEGQFLMGAFAGAFVGSLFASAWVGLIAAAAGGLFIGALLAILAIRYLVDQVVLGVVLNLLALGLTGFLYEAVLQPRVEDYNNPPTFPTWHVPVLSKIPILGPMIFQANVITYIALALVVIVHVALFHTRWGLRTRAVGEHPTAADTVGIKVLAVRYRNVLMAGVIAGVGGAFFTLGSVGAFTKNMTAGKGFIALAALIFGRWSPIGAFLAALLFGFADKLQLFLSAIGSDIPSQFLSMLPYLVTILAVAGLVGKVRAPAADGKPYVKG
ncbi:MAG TPA: ABC transporter permease [Micromonosporaceae bacterium]